MRDPTLSTGGLPKTTVEIEVEKERILEYIHFASDNMPPKDAKKAIKAGSKRLIKAIYADYKAEAREMAEAEQWPGGRRTMGGAL